MKETDKIVLSIEAAIAGGSLSLLRNGAEIGRWIGSSNEVSRAEKLLVNIDAMLDFAGLSLQDVNLVGVSAGPGSFTGIRIGLATALGIKTGLGIQMSSISAMTAIARGSSMEGTATVIVPVGRNSSCLQTFLIDSVRCSAINQPHTLTDGDLENVIFQDANATFLVHPALADQFPRAANATFVDANVAHLVGKLCSETPGMTTKPLFISKSF